MDTAPTLPDTAVPPPLDWIANYAADAAAVRDFCAKYGVHAEADTAVRFAKECFNSTSVRLQVDWDPEDEGEWLVIDVVVTGSVDEVLAMNRRFCDRWIAEVPGAESRERIRVLYQFI